jgi:hypothetical protein
MDLTNVRDYDDTRTKVREGGRTAIGLDFKGLTGGINVGVIDRVGECDVITGSDVQVWNEVGHALVVWLYNNPFSSIRH